jgi:hypothetical protein
VGDPKALRGRGALRASLAAVALLIACASLPSPLTPLPRAWPSSGTFRNVAAEFGCAKQKLPWFKLEELEVWPKRVQAGGQLGHRMVYVLCTGQPSDVVTGKLEMRILHRGKPIVDVPEPVRPAPGPLGGRRVNRRSAEASGSVYALELASGSGVLRAGRTFVVGPLEVGAGADAQASRRRSSRACSV